MDRMVTGREAPVHLVAANTHRKHIDGYAHRISRTGGEILLEPMRRNTALAVAVATAHALDRHGDRLIMVTPADHQVESASAFWNAVEAGRNAADEGRLVLIGIRPTRPETGFGYIQVARHDDAAIVIDVQRFHEKPDRMTAMHYLSSGQYFWNSGVFLFRPSTVRDWFLEWHPALWSAAEWSLTAATVNDRFVELNAEAYADAMPCQFDKTIVERATRISMVRAGFRWRDLGSWRSLVEATVSPWQEAQ